MSGATGAAGMVNQGLLRELMAHPFLVRRPPKSTRSEEFGAPFVPETLIARQHKTRLSLEDLLGDLRGPGRLRRSVPVGGGSRVRSMR